MKGLLKLLILCFALSFNSCYMLSKGNQAFQTQDSEIVDSIENSVKKWEKWYNEQQVDSLVSLYAIDAYIIINRQEVISGKENNKQYYIEQFERGSDNIMINIESIDVCSDIAIERGTWRIIVESNPYEGYYLTQWKLSNGMWLTELEVTIME